MTSLWLDIQLSSLNLAYYEGALIVHHIIEKKPKAFGDDTFGIDATVTSTAYHLL